MLAIPRVLVLAAGCATLAGCLPAGPGKPEVVPPVVTVSNPVEIDVVETIYLEGYTAAVSTVDIRARVTGYLSKIYFKDGEDVKEGAPLFLIDPRPYQAKLDQAKAEYARSQAQLKRLDADLARSEKLVARRTITQEEYDKTAADRNEAAADLEAKKATIEQADLDLHFAAIKAPISGRISRALVTEGNLVAANESLLTTIVTIDPIYAYFDVDEPTVLRVREMIREGKVQSARDSQVKVYLALDIDTGYPFEGTIDFIENRIDPKTGTLKLRAVFRNERQILTPGLHARIKLPLGDPHKALAVSDRAIVTNQGQKFVYVVDKENKVIERPVKLGPIENRMRVIAEGVSASDRVIVNGLQRVRPGVRVNPESAKTSAGISADTGTKQLAEK